MDHQFLEEVNLQGTELSTGKRIRLPVRYFDWTVIMAHGESLLSPTVAQKVLQQFAALPGEMPPGAGSLCDELTDCEVEVQTLVGEGLANKEIARQLCISGKTVKNHIGNIFSKLHVCDRTQAVLYAIRKGLVNCPARPGPAHPHPLRCSRPCGGTLDGMGAERREPLKSRA